jgi:hypothetical protein
VAQRHATEAVWLLGAPFFVQIIEGPGDTIAEVITGATPSLVEGQKRHDELWRRTIPRRVDTVVAALGGEPSRHGLLELASALACAVRVLQPRGRVVLLSEAAPASCPGLQLLREFQTPSEALVELERRRDFDLRFAWQWASATRLVKPCLFSRMPEAAVKELFAIPVTELSQVQQLLKESRACLFLTDAHKALAVVEA